MSQKTLAGDRRRRKMITALWSLAITAVVVTLIYLERTAILYILCTVSIAVLLQTVDRTIVAISTSHRKGTMVYTMLLDSTSWLAKLTGETTVTVYANGNLHEIDKAVLAMSDAARFNGFLFKVNGSLVMFADVEADRPGHPIGPN